MKDNSVDYKKKNILDRYKKRAPNYDQSRYPWVEGYLGKIEQEKIFKFLKGNSVLECGVATGRHAVSFGEYYTYVGSDVSIDMLKICKAKAKNRGIDVEVVLTDAENLAFRENIFDNVLCSKTFKLFPFPLKFLTEANRTLKIGGRCIVTFETIDSFWFRLIKKHGLKVPRHEKHYSTNEVVALFRKAKFSNIHVEHVANSVLGSYLFLWYVLYPTPFRRICTCLPSFFMRILLKLDERIGSKFLVMVVGEVE